MAKGWSAGRLAGVDHQTARELRVAARACSIASTGVAPTPADTSTTGVAASVSVKSPRGAAVFTVSPTRTCACSQRLTSPCSSRLTLMR